MATNELGNKIFINLVESFDANGDGVEAAGDELLVLDFGDPPGPVDWHFTIECVGNNSSSLCGEPDADLNGPDGPSVDDLAHAMALVGGAGAGTAVFYEFSRPLGGLNDGHVDGNPKEDLLVPLDGLVGLRLRVTQGRGGGKGGFVYPDPQTSSNVYHQFTIQ